MLEVRTSKDIIHPVKINVDDIIEAAAFILQADPRYKEAHEALATSKARVLSHMAIRRAIEEKAGGTIASFFDIEDKITDIGARLRKFMESL